MGPLTGVKVIEIASLAPAPFGCTILADLGADVLRVDRAGGGGLAMPPGVLDRGRRSIAVNLKSPEGVQVVRDLAAVADVFVEGFRPGVAERLGIGPAPLLGINPRLVYGRMTGWGQDGPLAQRAGHDINYIAVAGALEPVGRAGQRPHAPQNLLADFAGGGLMLALGVVSALYERDRSGEGQIVDAAMVDGAALLTTFLHGMHANGLWEGERGTNALDGAASFYDTYETSDGKFVAVGCVEPQFYAELMSRLGLDEHEQPYQLDAAAWPRMKKLIGDTFRRKTRAEWTEIFADSDACVSPVLSPWEAHEHPHNRARGAFVEVGGVLQPAPAPRFSRTTAGHPVPIDHGGRHPARTLTSWGINEAEAVRLHETQVVS
ncbi:CaiB/BaiF CoA-transferase family protein [Mycobacterium sp. CPCC 205372]|uniref:CaiB/BaiF CoA-transferase family protein n=1 Tax=Mycobacterium hippophais TaxID=3016340 RepID=A0ABT4PXM9_9MYCO|nr:CaiB/BaiF CoA-transferase family protein [Mycobacterium hippophais]MCZ8381275.1 CaiB/BaiF CoA-transferase family protein [Mycobacterium hippophais]